MFLTTNIYWWCAHLVWKGQVWNLLYNHDLKVNIKMLHVMVWVLDPSTVTQEAEKVTVICVSGGDHSAHDGLWPSASTGLSHIIHPTWEVLYCTVLTGTFYSFNFLSFCNHCTEVCVCVSSNRQNGGASNESTLSLFFRSLLPNFNFQVSAVYQPWYIYENTGHFSL